MIKFEKETGSCLAFEERPLCGTSLNMATTEISYLKLMDINIKIYIKRSFVDFDDK